MSRGLQKVPELLDFQLDTLKQEIDIVNSSIRQMDSMSEKVKNWGIVTWAAATGGAISRTELRAFIALTSFIPILFWIVDLEYRRTQRKFIWRLRQISTFLNSDYLAQSFEAQRLVNLRLLDPMSIGERGYDYYAFTSIRTVVWFKTASLLYIGMASMSLVAAGSKFLL
jgi:hypothetical protein